MGAKEDIVGEKHRESLFEFVEAGWPVRGSQPRDVLECSPESFKSCGSVNVLLGREARLDSKRTARVLEHLGDELRTPVGDDVLRPSEGAHGAFEEIHHQGPAGLSLEGRHRERSSGMAVEDGGGREVALVEERLEERGVHHPHVVDELDDHGGRRSFGGVGRLDHRGLFLEDSCDGSGGNGVAVRGDEVCNGLGIAEAELGDALDESTNNVGDAAHRRVRLGERANGLGRRVDAACPVSEGVGANHEDAFGFGDAPVEEALDFENSESLNRAEVREVLLGKLPEACEENIDNLPGQGLAPLGGREFGDEILAVDARVLDSGFVVSEGESEQSGGVEDGAVESSLLLVVNGAFPSEMDGETNLRQGLGHGPGSQPNQECGRLGEEPEDPRVLVLVFDGWSGEAQSGRQSP